MLLRTIPCIAAMAALAVQAQEYPARPITLLVPVAPGGGPSSQGMTMAD